MLKRITSVLLLLSPLGYAQSPIGYSTGVTVPIVAQTASFQSQIFIDNPNKAAISLAVSYVGGDDSATPGGSDCGIHLVSTESTWQTNLTTLCPGLNAGSNFGRLTAREQTGTYTFAVYSRVQNAAGSGFSVEGFPLGNFANNDSRNYVTGLRRQLAAPGFSTGCFISSMNEPVRVQLRLLSGEGKVQLGSTRSYDLGANQLIRLLDVFSVVGAPAGDYNNVRAEFLEVGATEATFVALCNIQNDSTLNAESRMAKPLEANDERMRNLQYADQDALGRPFTVASASLKNVHAVYLQHPDTVACRLTGGSVGQLEFQLKDPQGNVVAGGDQVSEFGGVELGEKSTRNNGRNGRWLIEVGSRGGSGLFSYGIECFTGNGSTLFDLVGTAGHDF